MTGVQTCALPIYGTEEVIEFCVDFIPDLKPIGVPESRYEGRLRGKGGRLPPDERGAGGLLLSGLLDLGHRDREACCSM